MLVSRLALLRRTSTTVLDSIRTRLVLLALMSTAPLLMVGAVNAVQDVSAARNDAQMEALRVAQLQADLIDEHVAAVDDLLSTMAQAIVAQSLDDAAARALPDSVLRVLPSSYTGLTFEPGGAVARPPQVISGRGVVLSRPVWGADGQLKGMLSATTRLDRLPRLETRDLPRGSEVVIVDERGTVLAHSPDYDAWVGRNLASLPFLQQALRRRQGTTEQVGIDAVPRLAAFTTASRVPWLVYVGLPSEIVLGSSHVAVLRNLWFGVLALGGAVLVAFVLGGRITAPLRRLTDDARALGHGDLRRRTETGARGEVGVLAAVFNQMAADVERHVHDVRASHLREQEARLTAEAANDQIAEREQRLQDLVRRLQVAQEEERRRVAYEIHDGLAQVAASAHQHLQTFADVHVPESPAVRADLERTVDLVQRTVREARRLIAGLRPTVLDDFGLATAIRLEVESLGADGWHVSLEEDLPAQRLPSQIETALFRVAQEALTNIRKHAGRCQVAVSLSQRGELIQLDVRDWGRGFAMTGPRVRAGPGERVGLLSMHERMALLHGRCTVTSQPGAGTRVLAEVPLRGPAAGGEGADLHG